METPVTRAAGFIVSRPLGSQLALLPQPRLLDGPRPRRAAPPTTAQLPNRRPAPDQTTPPTGELVCPRQRFDLPTERPCDDPHTPSNRMATQCFATATSARTPRVPSSAQALQPHGACATAITTPPPWHRLNPPTNVPASSRRPTPPTPSVSAPERVRIRPTNASLFFPDCRRHIFDAHSARTRMLYPPLRARQHPRRPICARSSTSLTQHKTHLSPSTYQAKCHPPTHNLPLS